MEYLKTYFKITDDNQEQLNNKNINLYFYIQCILNNDNFFKYNFSDDFHKLIINIFDNNIYLNYFIKISNKCLFGKINNDNIKNNLSIKLPETIKNYFLNRTNLNFNNFYNKYNYEKILRISFLGDKNIVDIISNKINIPFYGISNDINDPKYIESFNNKQLLPIEKSWFFHSQYSLIYDNYF